MNTENKTQEKRIPIIWAAVVVAIFFCCIAAIAVAAIVLPALQDEEPLPTRLEQAQVPDSGSASLESTDSSLIDRSYTRHNSMESLVENIAGAVIKDDSLYLTTWLEQGEDAPDHAYLVDFVVIEKDNWSREELLELAYVLLRETYFNYSGPIVSATLIIRADNMGPDTSCFFSLGLGEDVASDYLQQKDQGDLEVWFDTLKAQENFSDTVEDEPALAFGRDPADVPVCNLRNWKIPATSSE